MRLDNYLVKIWEGTTMPDLNCAVIICTPPMVKDRVLKQ
jgi:hypothetical protein